MGKFGEGQARETPQARAETSLPLGPLPFCLPLQPGGTRLTTYDLASGIPKPGRCLPGLASPANCCVCNRRQGASELAPAWQASPLMRFALSEWIVSYPKY